jgi:hypothetical protein
VCAFVCVSVRMLELLVVTVIVFNKSFEQTQPCASPQNCFIKLGKPRSRLCHVWSGVQSQYDSLQVGHNWRPLLQCVICEGCRRLKNHGP